MKSEVLSARVEKAQAEFIRNYARTQKRTVGNVLTEIVELFIEKNKKNKVRQ